MPVPRRHRTDPCRGNMPKKLMLLHWVCGSLLNLTIAQEARVRVAESDRSRSPVVVNQAPLFRADAGLVLVPVVVTDKADRPVMGLEKNNFQLYDDDVEQEI